MAREYPETDGYGGIAVLVAAVVGLAVPTVVIWWVSGFGPFYEVLFRIAPTASGAGAGVGADWVAGNTIAWLDFLIALTHAADVLMGVFVLFLLFVHWASFRRLAGQMRQPGESARGTRVAADGGDEE